MEKPLTTISRFKLGTGKSSDYGKLSWRNVLGGRSAETLIPAGERMDGQRAGKPPYDEWERGR